MAWQEIPLDRIYFDSGVGVPGTLWPIGTPEVPSDVIADVITMCGDRNLRTISVHGALTLGATMAHYNFVGFGHEDIADVIDLSDEAVGGSHIENLVVTGGQAADGFLTMVRCVVYALLLFNGRMEECDLYGSAMSFADGAYVDVNNCQSIHGVVTITVQAPARGSIKNYSGNLILTAQDGGVMFVRGFKGDLEIDAMTLGTNDIYMNGGTVTINADCTGGTINIYGSAVVTDNSVGAVVNDYTLDQRAANIDTQLDGILVQVPFYNHFTIDAGQDLIMFEFDALGVTIREIFISFWLEADGGATFTPYWQKTRTQDLVTFTTERPTIGGAAPYDWTIATPGVNNYYSYKLGELAQGLQGRFRLGQAGGAAANVVDAYAVVLMVV